MKFMTSWFVKENKGFVWFWDRVGVVEVEWAKLDFTMKIRRFSILAAITDFWKEIAKMLEFTSIFEI